ncbi:MAG: DUF2799 domain-containing protein [Rhodobacterales bacterium]
MGLSDGHMGLTEDYLAQLRQTCSSAGVQPNAAEWLRGHAAGVLAYCTPKSAYLLGRAGQKISAVCSKTAIEKMQRGYNFGAKYRNLQVGIDRIEQNIWRVEKKINELKRRNTAKDTNDAMFLEIELVKLKIQLRNAVEQQRRFASWPQ